MDSGHPSDYLSRRRTTGSLARVSLYIDPPSLHFLQNRLFDPTFAGHAGDRILAPYVHLKRFLESGGIDVNTADYLPPCSSSGRKVYVSLGILSNFKRLAKREDVVLSAFFALECPIVEPSMYRALNRAQHYFKRIFSWSDSPSLERFVGGRLRCEPFRWPQSYESVHEEIWRRADRRFLVMINGNKLPRLYWQELYTERMRAVEYFSRTGEIDLYGVGWDGPSIRVGKIPVPSTLRRLHRKLLGYWQHIRPDPLLEAARRAYRGFAHSKPEILGEYKFALCFENSILKGWVTEKIFDCFFAGTVPVYWGAPDIETYVPKECFVDRRDYAGYSELKSYLKSLTDKDVLTYKENARDYLNSPQFRPFTKDAFVELFARIVEEDARVSVR